MKKIIILTLLVLSTIGLQTTLAQVTLEPLWDVLSVSFSPDGTLLASGGYDNTVQLWDVKNHTNIATLLEEPREAVHSVSFLPDGTLLASGGTDDTVKLWDVKNHTNIATLAGHTQTITSVAFSPDGTTLASGSNDRTIKLWDVKNHTHITTLEDDQGGVSSVSFSPDGTLLASGSWDNTVKLWDVKNHTHITTLEGHRGAVTSVSFSPDGTLLASGSWDDTVKLWDVKNHTHIATLEGHRWIVSSVSFSPDGTLLASGSTDDSVKLWDVKNHTHITTLKGHTQNITSVSFSPDGTTLASGGRRDTVKLWNISEWTSTLEIISGDSQEGTTDAALASPLVVEVRDRDNNPLPDVQVTFTVIEGDGLLSGESTTVEVTTDANGRAAQTLILGAIPGANSIKVSIGSKSVIFEAEGISPYQLVKISGDEQRGTFGIALTNPLVVEVRDRDNNPLPDVQVTFTVIEGDGLLSGESTAMEVTTDANGKASQTFTLGYTITNIIEVFIGYERVGFYSAGASLSNIATLEGHRGDCHLRIVFTRWEGACFREL